MDAQFTDDAILGRFRVAVTQAYGKRLGRVILFGSRARGDFRSDSDYDIAVFLHDMTSVWDELRPLADITTDILIDTGAVISAKPFLVGDYGGGMPLMGEIRRDGVGL
jgi:predicted nucleotidyltransferase